MNMIRTGLYTSSAGLTVYALIALFFHLGVAVALIVAAMLLLITAGCITRVGDDCGYTDTVYGGER